MKYFELYSSMLYDLWLNLDLSDKRFDHHWQLILEDL